MTTNVVLFSFKPQKKGKSNNTKVCQLCKGEYMCKIKLWDQKNCRCKKFECGLCLFGTQMIKCKTCKADCCESCMGGGVCVHCIRFLCLSCRKICATCNNITCRHCVSKCNCYVEKAPSNLYEW